MKVCPKCKSSDVPDDVIICPFCLSFNFETDSTDDDNTLKIKKEQGLENKSQSKKKWIGMLFLVLIMLFVSIVVIGFLYEENGDISPAENSESADINDYTYNIEKTRMELEVVLGRLNDKSEIAEFEEILEKCCEISDKYNMPDIISEKIKEPFSVYKDKVKERIGLLDGQEARPALYMQIQMDLSNAVALSKKMKKSGLDIDASELYDKLNNLSADYTERLCTIFDDYVSVGIEQNGVISRSLLWSVMEGLDSTDLYIENENNGLYCRYRAAYIYHIDSELEDMNKQQAIEKILETLEFTEYNPLFIYYLSEVYGISDAKTWYAAFNSLTPDFMQLDMAGMKNFIYTYNIDNKYLDVRIKFSDYMKNVYNNRS